MKKRILYFTRDFSAPNIAFAKEKGLIMRNVGAYHSSDTLENADAVCGEVPERYQHLPLFDLGQGGDPKDDLTKLKVDEIKAKLTALQVSFEPNAKKDELLALLIAVEKGEQDDPKNTQ
ncbi:HeH/LEM domain-containing protein [Rodentibacter caecimuris]|uniref:HeH/LEM domain-containing protein n=1 Tax=Rodentibacter caecimuris TaxID=1796644 RepID=UPI0013A09C42|nr:HeH/LEM domain-containing protein [Rodentibacter heylii]QIA76649.1 hypothetical protein FEE42_04395 [Rodentibacter heylii]